jgi:hypothetical protein
MEKLLDAIHENFGHFLARELEAYWVQLCWTNKLPDQEREPESYADELNARMRTIALQRDDGTHIQTLSEVRKIKDSMFNSRKVLLGVLRQAGYSSDADNLVAAARSLTDACRKMAPVESQDISTANRQWLKVWQPAREKLLIKRA